MVPKLSFKIDNAHLLMVAFAARGDSEPIRGWNRFRDRLLRTRPDLYYELRGLPQRALFRHSTSDRAGSPSGLPAGWLSAILDESIARRLVRETELHRDAVSREWERNRPVVDQFQAHIGVGSGDPIRCFIVHPALQQGMTVSKDMIVWGHRPEFPNYASVFISHELLHALTNVDLSPVTHAVIELAADNELRTRLNRRGRYFEYRGHGELAPLVRTLLPAWRSFLRTGGSLFSFIERAKEQHGEPKRKSPRAA